MYLVTQYRRYDAEFLRRLGAFHLYLLGSNYEKYRKIRDLYAEKIESMMNKNADA